MGWLALLVAGSAWWPVTAFGPHDDAIARVADWIRLADTLKTKPRFDSDTAAFLVDLQASLETLDLEAAHALLPDVDGASRSVRFHGRLPAAGRYRVASAAFVAPGRLGDGSLALRMTPTSGAKHRVEIDGDFFGHVTASELFEVARRAAKWVADEVGGCAAKRGLDACDERVRAALRRDLPRTTALFDRYAFVDDIVAPDKRRRVRARMSSRIRFEHLAADYPRLAGVLRRSEGLVDLRTRIVAGDGSTVFVLRVDSTARSTTASFPLDLNRVVYDRYRTETDLRSTVGPGTRIHGSNIVFETQVVRTSTTVRFEQLFATSPTLAVDQESIVGQIVEAGLASILREHFDALTKSNGRGAFWYGAFPTERHRPMRGGADFELGSSRYVTFVLRVMRSLQIQQAEIDEMRLLLGRGIDAFRADFERFQTSR